MRLVVQEYKVQLMILVALEEKYIFQKVLIHVTPRLGLKPTKLQLEELVIVPI